MSTKNFGCRPPFLWSSRIPWSKIWLISINFLGMSKLKTRLKYFFPFCTLSYITLEHTLIMYKYTYPLESLSTSLNNETKYNCWWQLILSYTSTSLGLRWSVLIPKMLPHIFRPNWTSVDNLTQLDFHAWCLPLVCPRFLIRSHWCSKISIYLSIPTLLVEEACVFLKVSLHAAYTYTMKEFLTSFQLI